MHAFRAWAIAALVGAIAAASACASSEDTSGSGAVGGTSGSAGGDGSAGSGATGGSGGAGGSGAAGGSAGAAGSAGSAGSAGAGGGDAGPPVSVSGATLALTNSAPIVGFQVCVYQNPSVPCVMTNALGDYTISGVPGNSELLLEFTKTGYFPVLRTITTDTTDMDIGAITHPSTAEANAFAGLVGTSIDPTKGQVLALALETVLLSDGGSGFYGQDGVVASMTPMSGTGPFYTTGDPPIPSTTATATDGSGIGLFANVTPGEVEVEMTHPTKACTRYVQAAWQGTTPTASRVPVVAGYLVGGGALQCPP
jgi:hypothetical protein